MDTQQLEKELRALQAEFQAYRNEREVEEKKRLKAALVLAGAVIVAMGTFLWNEVIWPKIGPE